MQHAPGVNVSPPGANESCLCGSGRPFGACCADAYAVTTAACQRAREATRRLIERIADHALGRWGATLLTGAIDQFLAGCQERDMRHRWNPFYRWFAYTWIANWDDPEGDTPRDWPAAPLGIVWLESHPDEVSDYVLTLDGVSTLLGPGNCAMPLGVLDLVRLMTRQGILEFSIGPPM